MRNPLRSEQEAFRFLLVTLGGFGAIVLASLLGGPWAGIPVFIVVALIATWIYMRHGVREPPLQAHVRRRGAEDQRRILVIANETVAGERLLDTIRGRTTGEQSEVLVVSPALNSKLRHWASDEDGARAAARERLDRSLARLADAGIEARGEIGDSEPLQAMEDAMRTFGADEIVISTHPEGRSHWLERGIVDAARQRFTVPVTHVVVDLEAERATR
jgi:hypothetical protein